MRFDVYGRFTVEALCDDGIWTLYRLEGDGKRRVLDETIPPDAPVAEVIDHLEVVFHELGSPGARIAPLER